MLLRANAIAKGYSGARVETVELLLAVLTRGIVPLVPPAARSERAVTSPRSPTWRCRSSARGRRGSRGSGCPGAEALARAGLTPVRLQAKEGLSLINGTQFMAAMAALGARPCPPARAGRATSPVRCRSRPCRARSRASIRRSTLRARMPARSRPPRTCACCSRAPRSSSRIAGATRCRTRIRSAAPHRCTGRAATCSSTSSARSRSRSMPRPTTPSSSLEEREIVSNGNFHGQPVAFALDCLAIAVAELANISERRVERMVNPSLSDGLPAFLTREGGHQLGHDDPPVRVRCARLREQGPRTPRERGLDPDERRTGGSRLDGERRRAQGATGARERGAIARDRVARRGAGGGVPGAARARTRRGSGPRPRPHTVRAAARGPLAVRRHRARGDLDPGRRLSPPSRRMRADR